MNTYPVTTDIQSNKFLVYSGKVKIDYIKNNIVLKSVQKHNTGTAELFKQIAMALCGQDIKNNIPTSIHLYADSDFNSNASPSNIRFNDRRLIYEENSGNPYYAVELEFLIPFNQLHADCNCIVLYSSDEFQLGTNLNGKPLAKIILNNDEKITITDTANIIITWTLEIKNDI